jgi:hypothetical protein
VYMVQTAVHANVQLYEKHVDPGSAPQMSVLHVFTIIR